MTNTEKLREFCRSKDFRDQRDILSEECSEMVMMLSALNARYYSSFGCKPTLECYAWLDSLVDLEIMLTQMVIYCGEDSLEKYIFHEEENIKDFEKSAMSVKDDIYVLSYLNKMISKVRRNDSSINPGAAFGNFKKALYFASKRFIDDARNAVSTKGLMEYYNKLYSKKIDKIIEEFKEVT